MAFEKVKVKVATDEERRAAHIQRMSESARQKEEDRRAAMKKATADVEAAARKRVLG